MFTSLFNIMQNKQTLNIVLMKSNEKLIVSFQPLGGSDDTNPTGNDLSPLVVTATPQELDAGFIDAITSPLTERFEMITNLDEFKKSTQKAAPKQQISKSEIKVEEDDEPIKKKSKKEEQLEETERLVSIKNLPATYQILKKLHDQDKNDTKLAKRMSEVWGMMAQRPLFGENSFEKESEQEKEPVTANLPTMTKPQEVIGIVPEPEIKEKEDVFARILSQTKAKESSEMPVAESVQEIQPLNNIVLPPGMSPEQYYAFLEYQKFQESQKKLETV